MDILKTQTGDTRLRAIPVQMVYKTMDLDELLQK